MAVWAVSCRALGHACRQGLRLTSMHAGPCALLSLTGVWLQEGRTRRSVNIHALQRSHDQKTGGHSTCRHAHARTLRAHTHTCEGTCAHKKQTKTQMHAQKLHAGADTHCSACMQKCTHTHAPPPLDRSWTETQLSYPPGQENAEEEKGEYEGDHNDHSKSWGHARWVSRKWAPRRAPTATHTTGTLLLLGIHHTSY